MIPKREILEVATKTNLQPHVVEKDYVLGWLLAGMVEQNVMVPFFLSVSLIVEGSPDVHQDVANFLRGLRDVRRGRNLENVPWEAEHAPPSPDDQANAKPVPAMIAGYSSTGIDYVLPTKGSKKRTEDLLDAWRKAVQTIERAPVGQVIIPVEP
jgi:hypothetical protein